MKKEKAVFKMIGKIPTLEDLLQIEKIPEERDRTNAMSAFKLELLNGEELERVGIVVSMLPKCHVKTVMT